MPEGRKLTIFGKLVVLAFLAACLFGAYRLFMSGSKTASRQTPAAPERAAQSAPAEQAASAPLIAARKDVFSEIKARQTLVVGVEGDAPPMFFINRQGAADGFEAKLIAMVAAGMGVPSVKVVKADYAELPELARNGTIDMIIAGYVPDPSVDGVEWSDSYLDFGLCLVTLRSSAVTDVKHLTGKTIAVYDDPAAVRWVEENIPGANIKTFSGLSGWFEAVESREADALVYDYPFAAEEIKSHPKTHIVQFNLNQAHYSVGLPAANDALLDAVNSALGRIKESADYADLIRKYLNYEDAGMTKAIAGRKTYTVKPGDTLGTIAASQLGALNRWPEIWALNKARIPNPHLIYPQYVLIMP